MDRLEVSEGFLDGAVDDAQRKLFDGTRSRFQLLGHAGHWITGFVGQ